MTPRRVRKVTEPRDLRALAHPLRLRLLGALRLDGPATASALARRFHVNSGVTSYHLRALAARGFVEDDPRQTAGRERWWRASHEAHEWDLPAGAEEAERVGGLEAARALAIEHGRAYARWIEKAAASATRLPEEWRPVVALFDRWMHLTPEGLTGLVQELEAVFDRYADSCDGTTPGARRVGTVFAAFPDDGRLP